MHKRKEVDFWFKRSKDNLADGLTKNLTGKLFKRHLPKLKREDPALWRKDVGHCGREPVERNDDRDGPENLTNEDDNGEIVEDLGNKTNRQRRGERKT